MKLKLLIIMAAIVCAMPSCGGAPRPDVLPAGKFSEKIQLNPKLPLVDVRTEEEYSAGHLPEAVNIDFQSPSFVEEVKQHFPDAGELALYCRSGHRSAEAANQLLKAGYSRIYDLDGGILAWEKAFLPLTDGTDDLYTTPGGKSVKIQPLIHASLRIIFNGMEIEIDPVGTLGNRTTDYARFPKADLILVTHEHHDHLDPEAIKTLMKSDTIVIANPNSAGILGYGTVMKNGDKKTVAPGVEIEAVAAYNTSADKQQFHPKGRDNGYVLNLDGLRIYIAGDTEPIPEMKQLHHIDIAFLPCNLPYTMTPQQFIEAAEMISPKVVYPYHFGTTDLSSLTPTLAPKGIYVRIRPFDP